MSDATISFVVLGVAVALFIWNRLPADLVAAGSAMALYFTGVLSAAQLQASVQPVLMCVAVVPVFWPL